MKNTFYLSVIALFALFTIACNGNRKSKNFNRNTQVDDKGLAFIKQANEAGLTEIRAANLAQAKSKNTRVMGFAKMMKADHTVMTNELRKIAEEKYVTIKSPIDTLSIEHQEMIDSMGQLSGPAFDKMYMQMMVTDHGKVIELFKTITKNTSKTLNKFAEKNIPKLKVHLDSARVINSSL